MKKITVQVKDDHLELLARAKPMAALAELIWNALDAEATEVRIEFVENAMTGVDAIRICDNGHGLDYDRALVVFKNLGGSWKREETRTAQRRRFMHGQYGKGRFRAFALGNRVEWKTVYWADDGRREFRIVGRAAMPGEFEVTDATPKQGGEPGMVVEIADLQGNAGLLRGIKALQEVTDLFALYMRQYPDARIVYDGVPLDPANAEERSKDQDLGEIVLQNGERVRAELTIVEWSAPGRRGIVLCDEHGFALHQSASRLLFRGFSYTAYLRSAHFVALEKEGLLQLDDMAPDVKQLMDEARLRLRQYFTLREIERAQDLLAQWKQSGLYPYRNEPRDRDEEIERKVFDIYAAHLGQVSYFRDTGYAGKRLMLRLLQELVSAEPTRATRVLDEVLAFPEDKHEEVAEALEA